MKRWRRIAWWAFGVGAVVVLASLAWLTTLVLELERQETAARASATVQERLRLALWRMDAWLSPHLAREAARPYFEYLAYFPQERAYTRYLSPVQKGDVLVASPLLTFESEFVRLHFQVDGEGRWTSPQVPEGDLLPLAQRELGEGPNFLQCRIDLESTRTAVPFDAICSGVQAGEQALMSAPASLLAQGAPLAQQVLAEGPVPVQAAEPLAQQERAWQDSGQQVEASRVEQLKNELEFSQRNTQLQQMVDPLASNRKLGQASWNQPPAEVVLGPLVPLWLQADGAEQRLAFVRRVDVGASRLHQGFLVDWQRLRELLLAQVGDLLPDARLQPLASVAATGDAALRMASFPAELVASPPPVELARPFSPVRYGLLLTWLAGVAVLAAVGLGLHSAIVFADKRSRFASSVTHELRTPLTTFRMYSEMLARGMVQDEQQRREYCETLDRESQRLSTLVENVLSFARLEERRARPKPIAIDTGDLLACHIHSLWTRCEQAAVPFTPYAADAGGGARVLADREAVGQILLNLVDNACKYGRCEQPGIELRLELDPPHAHFLVCDRGPGVRPGTEQAIFRAFDRGGRDESDASPGIGLGLALSRGLARDLGGDLTYERPPRGGACFRLTLPLATPARER